MPGSVIDILKRTKTHTAACQTALPFMLMGEDGTPFTVFGFSRGRFFRSPFFTVLSINDESLCGVLEVLDSSCCGNKLFRTEAVVFVKLNCFCGIEILDSPVFDCLQLSYITKDQVCLPFMLTKNDSPKTIYRIDRKELQHAETISVHCTGSAPQVELILYTSEEIRTVIVPKDESRSITVANLQSIEIAALSEVVSGMVEIQLNFCEKKNIYY